MSAADLGRLAVVFGVGFVIIVLLWLTAGLRDREDRRLAAAPPSDPIPGLDESAPAPHYVQAVDLRRSPTDGQKVGQPADDEATDDLAGAVHLDAGWADPELAAPGASWISLEHPIVVWCADGVGSVRELLTVFALLGPDADHRPSLVLLADRLAPEVLDVLRANVLSGRIAAVAVMSGRDAVAPLADALRLSPLGRDLLLADYVPPDAVATCERWVSTATESWCVPGT